MSTIDKAAIMNRVETLTGHKQQALSELGIARSTYYRVAAVATVRWSGGPVRRQRKAVEPDYS